MTQRYAPDHVLNGFKLPNSLLKIQKGSQNDLILLQRNPHCIREMMIIPPRLTLPCTLFKHVIRGDGLKAIVFNDQYRYTDR